MDILCLLIAVCLVGCTDATPPGIDDATVDLGPDDAALDAMVCPNPDPSFIYKFEDNTCDIASFYCASGYPFKDDCGCGCAQDDPTFPEGYDAVTCTVDADCAVTELALDTCCDNACGGSQVYTLAGVARVEAWHTQHCAAGSNCPPSPCAGLWPSYRAVCDDAGQCSGIPID